MQLKASFTGKLFTTQYSDPINLRLEGSPRSSYNIFSSWCYVLLRLWDYIFLLDGVQGIYSDIKGKQPPPPPPPPIPTARKSLGG